MWDEDLAFVNPDDYIGRTYAMTADEMIKGSTPTSDHTKDEKFVIPRSPIGDLSNTGNKF